MKHAIASLALAFLLACGGGDGASYSTVREAAVAVADAACSRGDRCDGFSDAEFDECTSAVVADICMNRDCNEEPRATDSAINDCLAAIDAQECSAEELPGICVGLL